MPQGYTILKEVKEVGSGWQKTPIRKNFSKRRLAQLQNNRIARFGLNYIVLLLEKQGKKIEIVNNVLEDKADLIQDFVHYFFYGTIVWTSTQ